ncbi:MAG: hypothetical protein J4F41_00205 [Alphaproteobacteria bacterium]|nr:hypothetical protein [Alphaproteobacteria bacterium]
MSFATSKTQVLRRTGFTGADIPADDVMEAAIAAAVDFYSQHKPHIDFADITVVEGEEQALPDGWVYGVWQLVTAESHNPSSDYEGGCDLPAATVELRAEGPVLIPDPDVYLGVDDDLRITFSRPHVFAPDDSEGDAEANTLPVTAEEGVIWYAGSVLLESRAAALSNNLDTALATAGSVATTSRATAYAKRAQRARELALEAWQIKNKTPVAAARSSREDRRDVFRYRGKRGGWV